MKKNCIQYLLLVVLLIPTVSIANSKVTKNIEEIVAPFDGERFENIEPFPDKKFYQVLWWQVKALFYRKAWDKVKNQKFFKPTKERSLDLQTVVISHASVLIQMNDLNILADPHYSKRASPVSWAGPERVIEPAIKFEDLPPIDAVVISHDHYDHLDVPTLKRLSDSHQPIIYVGLGNKALLEDSGIKNVIEMDWWQMNELKGLKIHMVPVQHWSARGTSDRRMTLWGGFVIQGKKQVFFAGDTGYGTGKVFKMIHERLGDMDLSFIPIGAYQPRWFMQAAHVWPEESVEIHKDVNSKHSIGIHFKTFDSLTDESIDDPPLRLKKALEKSGISQTDFTVPEFGETYFFK